MKFNANFFKNLNPKSKKKKFKLVKSKKALAITSMSLLLATAFGLTGWGIAKHKEAKMVDLGEGTKIEQTTEKDAEETVEDEAFKLLADQLNIDGLTMNDDLTEKVQAEVEKQLEAANPTGGKTFSPDEVYVDSDGIAWVDEQEHNEYVNGGSTTVADGYLAPDGNVWSSEQDYLDYVSGQNQTGTTIIEGNFYTAPDGTIWSSQAEYEKYVASANGTVETPVENGTVVEKGEGYLAPDGTYWASEQDYLDYVEGQKNNTVIEDTSSNQVGTGSVESDYYVAPDGSVWASENDYLDYIDSMTATSYSVESSRTVVEEEISTVSYDDDYYIAPDGTVWMSESDYLDFSASSDLGTGSADSSSVEVVAESEYVETEDVVVSDTSNYYQDEDGNWWASYEDYLLYKQNEAELTK